MAQYLPDQNVLFLRTPHTNSNLIARAITQTLDLKVEEIGRTFAHKDLLGTLRFERHPYTVAFVRHPLDWYASFWRAKSKPGASWRIAEPTALWYPTWPIDPGCADETFGGFIAKATDPGGFLSEMFALYTGRGTSDEIHYIGKAETMLEDFCTVLDTVGVSYDRSALAFLDRKTRRRAEYSPEIRASVMRAEQEMLDAYHYRRPAPPPAAPPARGHRWLRIRRKHRRR